MKTDVIFKNKTVFSLEIFPPKPMCDRSVIYETLDGLVGLNPDFISITYSASSSKSSHKTLELASDVKNKYGIESAAHIPCLYLSEDEVINICDTLEANGIENILALRGDISPGVLPDGRFTYANELIEFIKQKYDFNIIAACYPEGHLESDNLISDIRNLKGKIDSGANQLITQLFLDNEYFFSFLERIQLAGINVPVEAGIMPVTNKIQIERMVKMCGIKLPKKFMKMIERYEYNPEALRDAGIAYAIDQIVDLIAHGVDGIHLYTMNNSYVARKIYESVQSLITS